MRCGLVPAVLPLLSLLPAVTPVIIPTAISVSRAPTVSMVARGAPDYEFELAHASRVVREASEVMTELQPAGSVVAISAAQQVLDFEMSSLSERGSISTTWVTHVDEHVISIALVDCKEGPVVGVVCRPETDEMLSAAQDRGAFLTVGDGMPVEQTCGFASTRCNVVHIPHAKCPEIEMAVEALQDRMPVDVTRKDHCCCCEGLFELTCGRADVHVTPPQRCLPAQTTPGSVLCAFGVLLSESGGCMSDIVGQALDYQALASGGAHRCGILATEDVTHNYILAAVRRPFTAERILLPRLEQGGSPTPSFRVEYTEGERIVKDLQRSPDGEVVEWDWASVERGEFPGRDFGV